MQRFQSDQSGRVTFFSIIIILMAVIAVYELSVIYSDWSQIKKIPLNIKILDDIRLPVSGVNITIDGEYLGLTDIKGEIEALISDPGNIHVLGEKDPFSKLDTTIVLSDNGLTTVFSMNRPYSDLILTARDDSGQALRDVGVNINDTDLGKTGDDGSLRIADTLHMNDSIFVKLDKAGYRSENKYIYLSDTVITDAFTMVKETAPAPVKPKPKPPAPAERDFDSYFNSANRNLDKAISGEPKYFGRALGDIDKAISLRPRFMQAKQLKVEILFNFAKSLESSNLLYEAANRCGEALKIYQEIPQDQMYLDIQKLKSDLDNKLK